MPRSLLSLLALTLILAPPAAGQSTVAPTATLPDGVAHDSSGAPDSSVARDTPGTAESPRWARVRSTVGHHADDYVGADAGPGAVYDPESAVYPAAPPFRYNRVEGLVVGFERDPLRPGADDQTRVFGQLAYATALRDLRYTVGVESQLYADGPTGLKLGVSYEEQTETTDRWKTSYLENSLAGAGFRLDFFDYYEAEGVTVYGVQDLPRTVQLSAGFRAQAHRTLDVETNWSVFGDGSFRANPAVEEGRMHTVFGALTAGRVRDHDGLPTGQAVRLAATLGEGLGGDFTFSRYEADGRVYLPLTRETRLAFRLRGGYATHGAPPQARFALGGIGSVRSYDQNRFRGTRMLLGNVEYLIDGATIIDGVLDDLYVAGLADAGWVGGPADRFAVDEVVPSAGFSVGLDERKVRLDVTWPLRDGPGAKAGPSIWLRISPNF
jgi:hypothetical protein